MAEITIKYKDEPQEVEVDMARVTWRDLIDLQKSRAAGMDEEKAIEVATGLVSKITGRDAWDLPAAVVAKILSEVLTRASLLGDDAKN